MFNTRERNMNNSELRRSEFSAMQESLIAENYAEFAARIGVLDVFKLTEARRLDKIDESAEIE